jgi:hypothetical protein
MDYAPHSISTSTDQPVTGPHHLVPLLIQSPLREETARLRKSSVRTMWTCERGFIPNTS